MSLTDIIVQDFLMLQERDKQTSRVSVQKYDADKSRPTVVVENVTGKCNKP